MGSLFPFRNPIANIDFANVSHDLLSSCCVPDTRSDFHPEAGGGGRGAGGGGEEGEGEGSMRCATLLRLMLRVVVLSEGFRIVFCVWRRGRGRREGGKGGSKKMPGREVTYVVCSGGGKTQLFTTLHTVLCGISCGMCMSCWYSQLHQQDHVP